MGGQIMKTYKYISKFILSFTLSLANPAFAQTAKKVVKRAKTSKVAASKKGISKEYKENAIREAAKKVGVPTELLHAICTTESNLDASAFVYADGGNNNHAYGMCQVLRETAEKFVGKDKRCERDFRGQKKAYSTCKLFGPKVNALAAAHYLKSQLDRYKDDKTKATAAYNSGSVKTCGKSGWITNKQGKRFHRCVPGDLLNRYYTDRVESVLAKNSHMKDKQCLTNEGSQVLLSKN